MHLTFTDVYGPKNNAVGFSEKGGVGHSTQLEETKSGFGDE